ncbi:hypothetical protein PVT71_16895 [Salipiger sp. H15]|uniref:ABC transporter domain-containing protein n=1 Tax=Alloyangia sp. H15 TaxID=3029062 RepID=A0AAU8APD6_9RHOB
MTVRHNLAEIRSAAVRVPVIRAGGLSCRDPSGALRLDSAFFTVSAGAVVGIAGADDRTGQTELSNILAGVLRPSQGRRFASDADMTHATARGDGLRCRDRARIRT